MRSSSPLSPLSSPPPTPPQPKGILRVKVVRASGLPRAEWLGRTNPYASISLLESGTPVKKRTSSKSNTVEPVWDQHFEFIVHDAKSTLAIAVKDDERLGKNTTLGETCIPLSSLPPNATVMVGRAVLGLGRGPVARATHTTRRVQDVFALNVRGKSAGEIILNLEWKPFLTGSSSGQGTTVGGSTRNAATLNNASLILVLASPHPLCCPAAVPAVQGWSAGAAFVRVVKCTGLTTTKPITVTIGVGDAKARLI